MAPNRGAATSLRDIVLAVQTEIPLIKQHLCDELWAVRGQGAQADRFNRLTGERARFRCARRAPPTIAHGFAMLTRFFPGARDELAAIDEEIVLRRARSHAPGKAHCFEDQYASTGGQLYELMAGHDRFIADLRPLIAGPAAPRACRRRWLSSLRHLHRADRRGGGVIVTDPRGAPLDAPLDVDADVAWVGYANARIRAQIEPVLQQALARVAGSRDDRRVA